MNIAHTIGLLMFTAIGFSFAIAIIGVLVFLTRKNLINGKNKIIVWIIGILQSIHILLFFTETLHIMVETNAYVGFAICVFLSLVCILLSLWLIMPFAKCKNKIKYLFLFFAIIQVFTTNVIFLIGDRAAGFPPPIQF
jgi:hypothetical protein